MQIFLYKDTHQGPGASSCDKSCIGSTKVPVQITCNGDKNMTVVKVALTPKKGKSNNEEEDKFGRRRFEERQGGGEENSKWGGRNVILTE